jgi:hypothetical protein
MDRTTRDTARTPDRVAAPAPRAAGAGSVPTAHCDVPIATLSGGLSWPGAGSPSKIRRFEVPGADATVIRRYTKVRADDGGYFIGNKAACHCHIEIRKPHFKVGTDDGSRINFGQDMNLERMQRAYEAMLAKHQGKSGFDDCKEYLEEQGCVEPEEGTLIDTLKAMLIKWGGLSDSAIFFYTSDGKQQKVDIPNPNLRDKTIEDNEEEIRQSAEVYEQFLDDGHFAGGQFGGVDEEAMQVEAGKIYGAENKAVKKGKK